MNRFLIYVIAWILIPGMYAGVAAQQPTVEITGTVTDENGDPLPGANITVKDVAGLGTATDVNGKYKIRVEQYKRLIFSFVGYEKEEVLITDQREVNVTLKESSNNLIDEVVITGTGVQKKLNVTGAIATVEMKELTRNPSSSITNALAGNVEGILAMTTSGQPGKNISEFWIRGISTFGASTSAYVLVDGFERNLNELNIEDIESISVLKDASATAIYGVKGANGVVLVTTKRGKDSKININVKGETWYNTRTITPQFVDGTTYAKLINEARITRNHPSVYQPEELELVRLGLDPDLYPDVDWMDLLLKDGAMNYRVNLNLSGGGDITRYYVSGSYVEEQGMYKTDEKVMEDYNTNANYKRWNYRMNADFNITKTTLLKVGVSGSLAKRNSPGFGDDYTWTAIFGYNPVRMPVKYSNGYWASLGHYEQMNPWVGSTQTGFREVWQNNVQTNVELEQNFDFLVKGLKFTGRYGYDTNSDNLIERGGIPEQWRAERARDANGDLVFTRTVEKMFLSQGATSDGNRREFLDLMLHYGVQIKENHNVEATLKFTRDAFIKTQNQGWNVRDGVPRRNQGLAGRIAYNWKYRYFADFNFGYTGSENFAKGHQYGFFPAYSFAWNVSEESFIKENIQWINMFKIRFSHGQVGDDQLRINNVPERFPYMGTIWHVSNETGVVSGYQWADYGADLSYYGMRYLQVASPYVTWEVATKSDLGVDISLFGDKVVVNADYFDEKREGIYMVRNYLPQMAGLESLPRANVGAVRSRGFDGRFLVRHKVGEVILTARGNMTCSRNEIMDRDEENNVYPYQMERGYRVNQRRGLVALGLFKDYDDIRNSPRQTFGTYQPGDIKYRDVNGDGVIDNGDRVAIGATARPNLMYGVGASVAWKDLDVNVHFQGAGKSTFPIYGKVVHAFSEGEWGNVLEGMTENRWISADISGDPATENPDASYPRLSYGPNPNNFRESTFWLRNGSYLRLKTVDIGYTIPKKIANRFRCDNLRVFLVGTNLLTWSSFKLWDPETTNPRGEDYPLAKSVTFGLTLNF